MKKIGIICEYNPFHNGHIYHINKIKEKYPNCFITLVMSSCFTERGEFSFLTKWDKTRIALENNIDLVVELPFIFATQSADTFAYYATTILEHLNMDYLVFGSETEDINVLNMLVDAILNNQEYDSLVKDYLDDGNSYPASISKALEDITGFRLKNSNDLLGISYIKAIKQNNYRIIPDTIKRTNSYLDTNINGNISSATSIRQAYLKGENISNTIPQETLKYLNIDKNYQENFYKLLKFKLINEANNLDKYLDVSEGIDSRIKKYILESNNYQELLNNVKSKRFTYNRLNRMFLHILFNLEKDHPRDLNYIRILGFNTRGRNYLKKIKEELMLPIVTNYKDIDDFVLKFELKTTILYLNIINKPELIKEELKSIPIKKD